MKACIWADTGKYTHIYILNKYCQQHIMNEKSLYCMILSQQMRISAGILLVCLIWTVFALNKLEGTFFSKCILLCILIKKPFFGQNDWKCISETMMGLAQLCTDSEMYITLNWSVLCWFRFCILLCSAYVFYKLGSWIFHLWIQIHPYFKCISMFLEGKKSVNSFMFQKGFGALP